ncbi:MAG: RNA polymerase sigma factor [Planctomycetes bacterium]|nr:RNA polymerase sigma factor [Planctomycetota bacterium]
MSDTTRLLLARHRAGDERAFAHLHERFGAAVLLWCELNMRPRLRALVDPADIAQEIWCRVIASLPTFDGARGRMRPWLFGIARHVMLDTLRRLYRRDLARASGVTVTLLRDPATTLVSAASRREEVARMLRIVSRLDDVSRAIVLRRGLEGYPHEAVAKELGISSNAVEVRWRRLRTALRIHLDEPAVSARTAEPGTAE